MTDKDREELKEIVLEALKDYRLESKSVKEGVVN